MATPALDPRLFRNVMGRFATGISVLTLRVDGAPRGMTANSITSVSLDPMLLLCCIARTASLHPGFESASSFAVNILAADQLAHSRHFARPSAAAEPMGGFAWREGVTGAPLLDGVLAWAECEVEARVPGGDHTIVLGRVRAAAVERSAEAPLLYYAGGYRELLPPPPAAEFDETADAVRSWERWEWN